ncbi:cell division protein FtsL [Marinospirillum alkaliphilum]|uniref:Cell division protein FtsL n=1 Tax=Marinospirillum alkaliphilum DSM 21637 TaxID=1122209 RepID=A0A1K1TRL1_9GAMM|nr:cell division protein FtsL [Marinospirillum alkaliphilum]SFX02964.1 cell division protein FtsL [Marinospirillum alkaliphilum DSM 21637]
MIFPLLSRYRRLVLQLPGMFRRYWLPLVLLLLLVMSAQLLIRLTHEARNQQVRLQTLEGERDALQVEWGRLLLEESALVSPARLEQMSRQQLQMRFPEGRDLQIRKLEQP